MKRPVIYIIIGITFFLPGSCGRKPGYVVSREKMTDVLYDIRLAQAIYNNDPQFKPDGMKDALIAGLLRKHDMTQAELDSSLLWYSDNIQYYAAINDTVAARLKARNELLVQSRMASTGRGRQLNLIMPPFFYLSSYTPTLSFDIDTVRFKNTKNMSSFHLAFDIQGLSASQKAEAAVYFNYKDTLVKKRIPIENNSRYSISKPSLPDSLLESISGYIHLEYGRNSLSNVLVHNISCIDTLKTAGRIGSPASADRPANGSGTSTVTRKPLIDAEMQPKAEPEKKQPEREKTLGVGRRATELRRDPN
jgi:hypothetical protein